MNNYQIKNSPPLKRFLVLGGRGFIGLHLVDALLSAGHFVRCFDRPNGNKLGNEYLLHPNFELYEGDFLVDGDIIGALEGCDICYHLISTTKPQSSIENIAFDVETNLLATIRLLELALKAELRKVIFISSGGTVYGKNANTPSLETDPTNPICSYGIIKLAIEKYLAMFKCMYGLDYTIFRISNCYGERQLVNSSQGAVAIFLDKVLRGDSIEIWGDGSVVRDYVYITDVIDALLLATNETSEGEHVFNLGSGEGCSINKLIDDIEEVAGKTVLRVYKKSRSFDVAVNLLSIERARSLLGWKPKTDLKDGLNRLMIWMLQNKS